MSDSFDIFIPSRFASTRLPGKALADIVGKPMIERVIEQCVKSNAERVFVATDDARIMQAASRAGVKAVLTSDRHRSGSERIAEAVELLGLADKRMIVNVQGDEPGMPPSLINQVAHVLAEPGPHVVSTAVAPLSSNSEMNDPSVVKAIVNAQRHALYFSRAPIPYTRNAAEKGLAVARRHIGIYGYRAEFVRNYAKQMPSPLEELEKLEQLRVLWHGGLIKCVEAEALPPTGVDTQQDLESMRRHYADR